MKSTVTTQTAYKSFTVKPSKNKVKKSDVLSPEYKLGLGIEKLLEQGVRVDKIDDVIDTSSSGRGDKPSVKKGFGRATNKNICLVKAKPKRRRFVVINGKRERISKLKQKQSSENKDSGSNNLKYDSVKNAVEACLKDLEKFQSKDQLLDDGVPINVQICCIKKPLTPNRVVRFQLPHTYIDELADICLFVPDQKSWTGKIEDPELTINKVQDFLKANNVTSIKKIITLHQVKTEYMVHELKRKLCHSYDFFLADHRLLDEIHSLLGKVFRKTRKAPVVIHLNRGNIKETINRAVAKSIMRISSTQDTFSCQIGHSKQEIDHLCENIVAVGQQLDKLFPGSFKNVRFLSVKTTRSMSFPIYYSTRIINEVKTPVSTPKRPKLYEVATDELSTVGKQVKVHPDGTVTVVSKNSNKSSNKKLKVGKTTESPAKKAEANEEDEEEPDSDEDFISSDEDFDDNETEEVDMNFDLPFENENKNIKKKKKNIMSGDTAADSNDESSSDDEDFSRKTEEAYLESLGGDVDSDDDDDDSNEEEKVEEKEEKVKALDKKKRKAVQNEDTAGVKAKKLKASISPDQSGPSKENNQGTTTKQANSARKKQKSKPVKSKTFDTSLGETWTIKKKCEVPMGEKAVTKKKSRSKSKLNKSQKKGNMKMKKAKLNKD